MILGAAGDAGGLVLDAAGMGAVIGVPANVVSTAAVVTGGAMVVGGMGDLVMHATSDDQTSLPARTTPAAPLPGTCTASTAPACGR